jgi:DNA-binding beta-propeller fold protein YncE
MRNLIFAVTFISITALPAAAQVAVSANEAKVTLVDGVNTVVKTPPPDTVTIFSLAAWPPRTIGELRVPVSVVGPPQSVAIAPDRSLALVTGAMKINPADPAATIPDDVVTVIDLRASPPAIVSTLHAGRQPSGLSINSSGTLALVANRADGTVSVLTIAGRNVAVAGKVDLGAADSQPSHVVFTRDGRRAFVTRNNDSLVSVLSVRGSTVANEKRDFNPGDKPYGIDVTPRGDLAIVANIGAGQANGADDTLAIVDLQPDTPRVVGHVTVGIVPEGLAISPDGQFVAITVMNGSNQPKASPWFHDFGLLKILRLSGRSLAPVTEAKIGHWCQGVAWSPDSRGLLVQCMVEREIQTFRFSGTTLTPGPAIRTNAGPAGIRAR